MQAGHSNRWRRGRGHLSSCHKSTTFVLHGRRGTHGTEWRAWARFAAALAVAGVALGDIYVRFTWQAWHNLTSTFTQALMALGGALEPALVARDAAALCVAGVTLGDIYVRFTWQAWHNLTSTVVLHRRRGTHGTGRRAWALGPALVARDAAALCVAGVALGDIYVRFTWQAWHSWHWVAHLGPLWSRVTPRHFAFHTFFLRFAWQAWRSWHWMARLGPLWSRVTPRHFAWQAWHLVTCTFVSRGRRSAISHPPAFCVAGLALMALGGALGPALAARDAAALCVAGVALGDIYVRFTWQAWHNLTSTIPTLKMYEEGGYPGIFHTFPGPLPTLKRVLLY